MENRRLTHDFFQPIVELYYSAICTETALDTNRNKICMPQKINQLKLTIVSALKVYSHKL